MKAEVVGIIFLLASFIFLLMTVFEFELESLNIPRFSFRFPLGRSKRIGLLKRLLTLDDKPFDVPGRDNIFFIETSCVFNFTKNITAGKQGGLALNGRQACAVYSAAVAYPEKQVHIIHTCPVGKDYYYKSSSWSRRVLELPNVDLVPVDRDPRKWMTEAPLSAIYDRLLKSSYPLVHSSDILRMLLLWKYGGTYLDMDIIVLRNFSELGENFAGDEGGGTVNNAVINFSRGDPGHRLLTALLKRMDEVYDPSGWTTIGPALLSDVIYRECKIPSGVDYRQLGRMDCGFRVYGPEVFYPIHYSQHAEFFKKEGWESVKQRLEPAFTAHLWNKLSAESKVEPGSAYARIAEARCPPIYTITQLNF